jgi:alpha-beta hydrolase superfamily lysophospholipase
VNASPGVRTALLPLLLALCCLVGCDSTDLMPWHTEELESEYSSQSAANIGTFADYLQLEDKVFAELDQRIYAHTATGPEHILERFSRGSLADPGQRQPNWNRSFELSCAATRVEATSGAVLLLHGMSDSPYSLRAIAEALCSRGYQVVGLRMPGHGTLPAGLLHVQWTDMAQVVRLGMRHLAQPQHDKPLYIIGYSTGAALALDYVLQAEQDSNLPRVDKLVLISPAIGVRPAAALAKWTRRLSQLPGLQRLAWMDIYPEFDPYKYNSFTTNAAEQVYALTQSVAARIAARNDSERPLPPMLILKSTVDATVSNNAVVDRLLLHLAPGRHELVVFDINRFAANSSLLKHDPGPFTARMIADRQLPFTLTLVTNASAGGREVAAFSKPPFAAGATETTPLSQSWPREVFSLSHVALPFASTDPLYGAQRPLAGKQLFLGMQALQGERGVLKIPGDFLLRLRHNPFYEYQEARVLAWLE